MSDPDRIAVEISRVELLVLKKMVLINVALAKSLGNGAAGREQLAMTRTFNDIVLRADLASKVSA